MGHFKVTWLIINVCIRKSNTVTITEQKLLDRGTFQVVSYVFLWLSLCHYYWTCYSGVKVCNQSGPFTTFGAVVNSL